MNAPLARAAARLETDRLILRQLAGSDVDAYAEMCSDAEVMRYLSPDGTPLSREDAWRQMAMFAGHWALRGYGMWAVEERATGKFIGRVGLHYPEGWPGREIGWALCRDAWGKGFASEAASAAIRHAFDHLGWPEVISLIHPGNARSISLARRLGERQAGEVTLRGATVLLFRLVREGHP